jgi:tetratricopeptide (TPR) repeat protein
VQIVEYSVLSDRLIIWLITRNSFKQFTKVVSSDELQKKVSDYVKDLSAGPGHPNVGNLSRGLFDLAVAPVASDLDPQKVALPKSAAFPDKREFVVRETLAASKRALDEAEKAANRAAEIDPRLAIPHTLLGKIYVQQGKYNEAETHLLEASRLDPKSWEAPYELARCYYSMKQFDKAMKVGLRVHEMPGAPTTVHLLMVDLYGAVHDRDNALRELEEFGKADPQSPYMAAVKRRIDTLKKN